MAFGKPFFCTFQKSSQQPPKRKSNSGLQPVWQRSHASEINQELDPSPVVIDTRQILKQDTNNARKRQPKFALPMKRSSSPDGSSSGAESGSSHTRTPRPPPGPKPKPSPASPFRPPPRTPTPTEPLVKSPTRFSPQPQTPSWLPDSPIESKPISQTNAPETKPQVKPKGGIHPKRRSVKKSEPVIKPSVNVFYPSSSSDAEEDENQYKITSKPIPGSRAPPSVTRRPSKKAAPKPGEEDPKVEKSADSSEVHSKPKDSSIRRVSSWSPKFEPPLKPKPDEKPRPTSMPPPKPSSSQSEDEIPKTPVSSTQKSKPIVPKKPASVRKAPTTNVQTEVHSPIQSVSGIISIPTAEEDLDRSIIRGQRPPSRKKSDTTNPVLLNYKPQGEENHLSWAV